MLTLKIPFLEDMPFRQAMLSDPETMTYNRGGAPWEGYDPATGCIAFPESEWAAWLDAWVGHAPERYCAFLSDEGRLVGEVNWHRGGREMGIVVAAGERGKGYGVQGLRLLTDEAFRLGEIDRLENRFEADRDRALSVHLAAGFVPVREEDGLLILRLTRERYDEKHRQHLLRLCMEAMCDFDAGDAARIGHFVKVHGFARQIAVAEGLDDNARFTLETAAIVHDIGIHPALAQYGSCEGPLQEKLGPPEAERMLAALGYPMAVIRRVSFLVAHHHTLKDVFGIDWQILLEADFLVNMVEESLSPAAATFFRTSEGSYLLSTLAPPKRDS